MKKSGLHDVEFAHSLRVGLQSTQKFGTGQVTATANVSREDLNVTVSSVEYPVFVLGAHDPDDSIARYIP